MSKSTPGGRFFALPPFPPFSMGFCSGVLGYRAGKVCWVVHGVGGLAPSPTPICDVNHLRVGCHDRVPVLSTLHILFETPCVPTHC